MIVFVFLVSFCSKNLLNDLRHDELVIALGRGVAERLLGGEAGFWLVVIQHIGQRERVRGRFDAVEVERIELFHVVKYLAQLRRIGALFLVGQVQSREPGDLFDVNFGVGHDCLEFVSKWIGVNSEEDFTKIEALYSGKARKIIGQDDHWLAIRRAGRHHGEFSLGCAIFQLLTNTHQKVLILPLRH